MDSTVNNSRSPTYFGYGFVAIITFIIGMAWWSFNSIQSKDEDVNAAFSEILNQYQRRFDLIPNLVNTIKGYAKQETDVLTRVTQARASVGKITLSESDLSDEKAVQRFQQAQSELGNSLSRLMVVSENYPTLRSDALFQDMMAQLEGTENRIAVARGRYIKAVNVYNTQLRQFPTVLIAQYMGYQKKSNFSVKNEEQISAPPTVNFN